MDAVARIPAVIPPAWKGTHTLPPGMVDYALHVGTERVQANRARYAGTDKERPDRDRSSVVLGAVPSSLYTEAIGILAESMVRHLCDCSPTVGTYTASTYLKPRRLVTDDPDLTAEGTRMSVKGCEGALRANVGAVRRCAADVLVFVLFRSPALCDVYAASPRKVMTWAVREAYTPYYHFRP